MFAAEGTTTTRIAIFVMADVLRRPNIFNFIFLLWFEVLIFPYIIQTNSEFSPYFPNYSIYELKKLCF
jgi:hypothetical protein